MLKSDTILRRLPSSLDRKQALFLDGIRHSAEIVTLAYERLKIQLTKIATENTNDTEQGKLYTSAFLDAWATIDAIDRFRCLYNLFPHKQLEEDSADTKANNITFQNVRDVRNVTDHLAQRMEHVLAHKSAAMGILSWCTAVSIEKGECLVCSILPGTLGRQSGPFVNPAGKEMELPTGLISITAGEHTADLSGAVTLMSALVRDVEEQIEKFVADNGLQDNRAGTDLLIRLSISFDVEKNQ